MIKQIGTIGFYIRFNESASAGLKFLEIFSSSAASVSLFSASTNSSEVVGKFNNSASYYLNGSSASTTYSNEWQQMIFVFSPKLQTDSANNFLIRFGDTSKANFNIQNLFIVDTALSELEILYIYNDFTSNLKIIQSGDQSTKSLSILDRYEPKSTSSATGTVYQSISTQNNFIADVAAVTSDTAPADLYGDNRFFDTYEARVDDYILCLADNKLYQVDDNSLTEISTSNGDYVKIINGLEYAGQSFVKTSGSFTPTQLIKKIESFLVTETLE